jgi:hypothetical protein
MSNQLHATKLSNGRLQLWVISPAFFTILPESPGAGWNTVQPTPSRQIGSNPLVWSAWTEEDGTFFGPL